MSAGTRPPARRCGYLLTIAGLAFTLVAMGLDAWTRMGGLELVTGCLGLITSVAAAIIMACHPAYWRERANELSGAIPGPAGHPRQAR